MVSWWACFRNNIHILSLSCFFLLHRFFERLTISPLADGCHSSLTTSHYRRPLFRSAPVHLIPRFRGVPLLKNGSQSCPEARASLSQQAFSSKLNLDVWLASELSSSQFTEHKTHLTLNGLIYSLESLPV